MERYDIANKILKELADLESRYILFTIIRKSKTSQEIAYDLKIPTSSVYKKIQDLFLLSLVEEEGKFSYSGRIARYYQSRINEVRISIVKFEPEITFNKNPRLSE